MIICAAGDTHGAIDRLYQEVLAFEESLGVRFAWVLHVGDFGIWPDPTRIDGATKRHDGAGDFPVWWVEKRSAPRRTLFIKGNHEDFVWLDEQPNPEVLPGLFYLRNGTRFDISDGDELLTVGGLGGCFGPSDFERRSRDLQGYRKRHYTRDEIDALISGGRVDVLLIHDAPTGVVFERHRRGAGWASESEGLDDLVRGHGAPQHDGIIAVGPFTFVVEWKGSGLAAQVATAVEQVQRCAEADAAWLDLSGNARIFAPGLRILVEGKPNQFKRRGRPSSAFAPKSSRVTRWLLMHPNEPLTQREIARATDTDEGYTSKIVSKLEHDGLIVKDQSGAIKPRDPDLLLDAWREDYDFTKHHIVQGHIAARSGDALLRQLVGSLQKASAEFAATGLAAAWLMDRFAGFRTTSLYLAKVPTPELLDSLSFREDERGANVWLVVPNDEGVFHGACEIEGIRCVHPVQVYLDLGAHPERADEAASKLRTSHLTWRTDA